MAGSRFDRVCEEAMSSGGKPPSLVLCKEDFRDGRKFEELTGILSTIPEDDVNEVMIVPSPGRLDEEVGGMGSAAYVSASVDDPGAADAVFVPAYLYPRSKGRHIARRAPLEKGMGGRNKGKGKGKGKGKER